MRHLVQLLLLVSIIAASVPVQAQEATADSSRPPADAAAGSVSDEETSEDGAAGAAEARRSVADDEFVPSEEIPPDEQVVFPVDI
jgi:hypothetical protein